MSGESDQVWENMSVELRKLRRRRLATRVATLSAVAIVAGFFAQRAIHPDGELRSVVTAVPEVSASMETAEVASPQLAVLVYDGEGMRFELMDGERLAGREMKFSLQPVVMGPEAW